MSESFPLSSILADDFPLFLFERNIKHQKWTSLSPICSQSINKILLFLNLFHILFFFFTMVEAKQHLIPPCLLLIPSSPHHLKDFNTSDELLVIILWKSLLLNISLVL